MNCCYIYCMFSSACSQLSGLMQARGCSSCNRVLLLPLPLSHRGLSRTAAPFLSARLRYEQVAGEEAGGTALPSKAVLTHDEQCFAWRSMDVECDSC